MWYEEQFCSVTGPRLLSDVDEFISHLNALGRDGWDIAGSMRTGADDVQFLLMNKQRQISTQERVDQVIRAVLSRGLSTSGGLIVSMPNPLSDDGRIECAGDDALREIVRLVLEES